MERCPHHGLFGEAFAAGAARHAGRCAATASAMAAGPPRTPRNRKKDKADKGEGRGEGHAWRGALPPWTYRRWSRRMMSPPGIITK